MKEHDEYNPPDEAIKALARRLYPAMRAYFESAEGRREFARWQAEQGARRATGGKSAQRGDVRRAA